MTGKSPVDLSDVLMLVVDSRPPARVRSARGGLFKTSMVNQPAGRGTTRHKHVAVGDIEPIVIEMGPNKTMLQWAAGTLRRESIHRTVSLYRAETDGSAVFEIDGYDCLLTELMMPRLDRKGKAKAEAFMRVVIMPERSIGRRISDHKEQWPQQTLRGFNPAMFDLQIDGLALKSDAVLAVEPLGFTLGTKRVPIEAATVSTLEATKEKPSQLVLTVQRDEVKTLTPWLDTAINTPQKFTPATGTLGYTSGAGKPVMRLNLYDITPVRSGAIKGGSAPVKITLDVGRMEVDLFGGSGFE